ncbi:MAG: nuclear transport factor 2 family protein [Novosphingobium sp.]|nr:nuclear transport factor 2 family protein [Novosphingobium sp.]
MLQETVDRREIYDCLMRYCRGIDRLDRAVLLSAYHPDAVDDHGTFVGPVEKFADYVLDLHRTHQHRTQHHITNHRCDIEGAVAHCESYYIFRSLNKAPPLYTTASGRYLDRLEKRDGRWGIVDRVCLVDIRNDAWAPTGTEGDAAYMPIRRDREDTSYRRPLKVNRARWTV